MSQDVKGFICVRGARHHNLKSINLDIPKNKIVVITGPSGSGKSSLAFDTLYAEGQRRYIESLSSYARQFIPQRQKPDVDSITGLPPSISIDQKTTSKNPRSTVATITEIQDYLRIMFARLGIPYSPKTGLPIIKHSSSSVIQATISLPEGTKVRICAPTIRNQKGNHSKEAAAIQKQGYEKIKINGQTASIEDMTKLDKETVYNIDVIIDRIIIKPDIKQRVENSIRTAMNMAGGMVCLDIVELPNDIKEFELPTGDIARSKETLVFSESLSCPDSNFTIPDIQPRIFSFNSPYGACPKCNGLGKEVNFKKELIVPDPNKSIRDGAIKPWHIKNHNFYLSLLQGVAKEFGFSVDEPFEEISEANQNIIFNGSLDREISFVVDDGYSKETVKKAFDGILADLSKTEALFDEFDGLDDVIRYRDYVTCSACHGYRLKPESLCIKVNNKHIGQVLEMSVEDAFQWFENLKTTFNKEDSKIAKPLIKEISSRISFLIDVGLDYLTLARESSTLSGGEAQRIRLASQVGSGLCSILYVLDEPSIGLHQSDNHKLIQTLKKLCSLDNSIIVVEHDTDTMLHADYLIDIGPEAGKGGGFVVAEGTVKEVMENPNSITGAFLTGREEIELPKIRRKFNKRHILELIGASENNLKNINLTLPLGLFVAVTGVSGGGKSTMIIDTLYKALAQKLNDSAERPGKYKEIKHIENIDKVIKIDQSAIGRTPRSNPATYTGLFTLIRDWFTALPESKMRGYKSSRFSFNVKNGRCENCKGEGVKKIEMHFLPDVYVECSVCNGKRYDTETLEVKHKGKNISDVLDMTVKEAIDFFKNIPTIFEKLICLNKVGLGYMAIGQQATTLSGGEAQRIKLAKELSKKATGETLYILDEPTTGLHSVDIKKLLKVLHQLVDNGNTVLVIEHNVDVIKTADYVIDVGPRGGRRGGEIVSCGSPEEVAEDKNSVTGPYIKEVLNRHHERATNT